MKAALRISRTRSTSCRPTIRSAAASAISASLLDREVLAERVREIGEQAASEIHAVFTAETEARLKLFRTLSIDSDRTRIGREAHSLKSDAGTFGYRELARLALRLERDAVRLAEDEYRELLDSMDGHIHPPQPWSCSTERSRQRRTAVLLRLGIFIDG